MASEARRWSAYGLGVLGCASGCGPGASTSEGTSDIADSGSTGTMSSATNPSGRPADMMGSVDDGTEDGGGDSSGRPDLDVERPCDGDVASWVATDGVCDGNTPCFTSIQDAVDAATEGTTIWVAPGNYTPSGGAIHVVESVSVLLCLRSLEGPLETVLDGQDMGTVVRAGYEGPLWLEGFTVRRGGPDASDVLDGYGVAIGGWEELHGWIVNNIIEDNVMGRGAVVFTTSTVDFHADILVSGNVVRDNAVDTIYSGAVQLELTGPGEDSGTIRIENNLLVDNDGGGIGFHQYLASSPRPGATLTIEIVNNTATNNTRGMTIPVQPLVLHNNIVYGNETDFTRLEDLIAPSVLNNLMGDAPGYVGVGGNISEDPEFVDPTPSGDYHLAPTSVARDAGTSELATTFDLEGRPRDGQPDIGAYELP